MNYCTIQDAWGRSDISSQYKEFMGNTSNQLIDRPQQNENKQYQNQPQSNSLLLELQKLNPDQLSNLLKSVQNNTDCTKCMNHFQTCSMCQNKLRNHYRSPLIDKIDTIINTNRDNIVLGLVVIFILVIFNLISNINK